MHKIEQRIKMLLNSHTMRVNSIKDVSNPKQILEFNNRFASAKKSYLFCSEIGSITKFPLATVPLNRDSTTHQVYFCEVAIENPLFVNKEYADSENIPASTSTFITDGSSTAGYFSDQNVGIENCVYVIKDRERILPLYFVTFEYNEEFELKSRGRYICHRCMDKEAVMFCPSERANFCAECDEIVHHDSFLRRHDRKYFSEVGQKKFICCSNHPTRIVEYFCTECFEPLCSECKITGNHSTGESTSHPIKNFLEACKFASENIDNDIEAIVEDAETVKDELVKYRELMGIVKSNFSEVRKQLEQEFKTLDLKLRNMESLQRQKMNAEYIEKVGKQQILTQLIEYPGMLDPADLLSEYKSIQNQRQSEERAVFGVPAVSKVEVNGSITFQTPKMSALRDHSSNTENKTVGWRIETMNCKERGR